MKEIEIEEADFIDEAISEIEIDYNSNISKLWRTAFLIERCEKLLKSLKKKEKYYFKHASEEIDFSKDPDSLKYKKPFED